MSDREELATDIRRLIDASNEQPRVTDRDEPVNEAPEVLRGKPDLKLAGYHPYCGQAGNDCGQAAIAGLLDCWNVNLGNMGPGPWPNDLALAQIKADGFGPDFPNPAFAIFGTTGGQIERALRHYGSGNATCLWGSPAWPVERCWQTLTQWVVAGWPVPVLVQADYIMPVPAPPVGGTGVVGHWPVVTEIDASTVTFHNVRPGADGVQVTKNAFLSMWNYLAGVVPGAAQCFVVGSPG